MQIMPMTKNFTEPLMLEPDTLVELLRWRARHQTNKQAYTFLVDGEIAAIGLTYGELEQEAIVIAARLQSLGIAPGERALLLYPAGLEYIAAFFGCLYAGVVAVPSYPPMEVRTDRRLRAILADAQPSVVLSTTKILDQIMSEFAYTAERAQPHQLATDSISDNSLGETWREPELFGRSLAFLQYTSGSTNTPKGVMVSHGNLLHNERMIKMGFQSTEKTVIVSWLPLFHDMGLIGAMLQPLYLGTPCILMSPMAFLRKPARWLEAISRYRATISGGPNFAYELCARKLASERSLNIDLSGWEIAFNGAEPVRADTLERFAAVFNRYGFRKEAFYPCYGLAEATLFVSGGWKTMPPVVYQVQAAAFEQHHIMATQADENTYKIVGCGQTWLDQKIVVVDPDSLASCSSEQVGEIWLAGPSIAEGYWNRPAGTMQTFRNYLDNGEGPFLRTGDLGFLKNGELFVTGRLKDMLIIRGRNYYPQDIEYTVEQSDIFLRPGCSAAFTVDIGEEELLVIVAEIELRYQERRQASSIEHPSANRRSLPERRHKVVAPGYSIPDCPPLDTDRIIKNIRKAVAKQNGLRPYTVLLLKAGSIAKTSSGKIQRHACRIEFFDDSLSVINGQRSNFLG